MRRVITGTIDPSAWTDDGRRWVAKVSRPMWYTLDDQHRPIPHAAFDDAVRAFEERDFEETHRVALDAFSLNGQAGSVSTVFLCVDHNFSGEGDPVLFETMLFGLPEDMGEVANRYTTWDAALAGHAQAVAAVEHWIETGEWVDPWGYGGDDDD